MDNGDRLRNRYRFQPSLNTRTSAIEKSSPSSAATLPIAPQKDSYGPQSQKKTKKNVFLLCGFTVFVMVILSGAYFISTKKDPTPASVKSQAASISLFYPSKLPQGFVLDEKSYTSSGGIISFHASNDKGQKVLFTIQPRPSTFDYQAFYQKGLTGTEQFVTPNGEAAVGRAQAKLMGSLVSNKTWVIVSANTDKVSVADLKLVLNNLKLSD